MKINKVSLLVYFAFVVLAILANSMDSHSLMLVSKPFVVPSMLFYYLITSKKISKLFVVAVSFSFIGEAISLMGFSDEIYYMIIPFFISNVLLCIICLKNFDRFKLITSSVLSMLIFSGLLVYIFFAILDLFSDTSAFLQMQITLHGISLVTLAFLSGYKILTRNNLTNLYLSIYVTCIFVSGVFYILYNFKSQLIVLDVIHFSLQMISYYFLISFMLHNEKIETDKM